jgi:hypothetical protein
MAVAFYNAVRGIQAGHSVGVNYSFEFTPMSMDKSNETILDTSISISGRSQHMVERRDTFYQITTDYYTFGSADYLNIYEFLESVDEREVFTFSALGTIAVPAGDIVAAELTGNYSRTRLANKNIFQFSFGLRLIQ